MKDNDLRVYSGEDLDAMEGQTDWERLAAMEDEDIDPSDIPRTDDAFWENAEVRMPEAKADG